MLRCDRDASTHLPFGAFRERGTGECDIEEGPQRCAVICNDERAIDCDGASVRRIGLKATQAKFPPTYPKFVCRLRSMVSVATMKVGVLAASTLWSLGRV